MLWRSSQFKLDIPPHCNSKTSIITLYTHTYTHTHFIVAILSSTYSPNVHTLFTPLFSLLNVSFQIHSIWTRIEWFVSCARVTIFKHLHLHKNQTRNKTVQCRFKERASFVVCVKQFCLSPFLDSFHHSFICFVHFETLPKCSSFCFSFTISI